MLISRTPLRITLGGGGSDLLPNGRCVTAAIDLAVYIALHHNRADDYSLKYSDHERVHDVAAIKHPLIRACLELAHTPPGVEITSMSDVTGGSGLGSSGAFTVGLLRVLFDDAPKSYLAETATRLDIGQQDQYAATYGGLRVWQFGPPVISTLLPVPDWFNNLYLYDTGLRRDAYETLQANPRPDRDLLVAQAAGMLDILENGTPERFAESLNSQWQAKLRAAPTEAHLHIDRQVNQLLTQGAWGAKLIGAGDGGMILAYHPTPGRDAFPVRIDQDGSRLL